MKLTINGRELAWEGEPEQPLLWVLRDDLGLTGSKYGCGIGVCGACTVHVDGRARPACRLPMRELQGAGVTTIEGLPPRAAHAVRRAWVEEDVPQCGYCQAGQVMAVVELLRRVPAPDDDDIDRLHTNLCRCGSHVRIRRAIHRAARYLQEAS
jgi:isoquinoline 1-oxidoreductase alpha subunit